MIIKKLTITITKMILITRISLFSTTICVPLSGISAVYDGVSAYRKRSALACAHRLLDERSLSGPRFAGL